MKFLHLTSTRNVRSIRRVGLRLGDSPVGRGVNCVPLMWVPVQCEMELEGGDIVRHLECPRLTSARLWTWLVRKGRAAAVIFQPKAQHWPAELMLLVPKPGVNSMAAAFTRADGAVRVLELKDDYPAMAREPVKMRIEVRGPRVLGVVVREFVAVNRPGFVEGKANTQLYVLFRKAIPANCIHAIHDLKSDPHASRTPRGRGLPSELDDLEA